ncbi:MAG: glutaredoxin 3 [Pseudomonadales bacterium]|nr:glutaredoxin 3 [Pseudomonadales bacterium]
MPAKVTIYTTQFCPYCIRARMLLDEKGVEYEDFRVDLDASLRQEMVKLSKRHTVPQIWIGERHIGGFTDLSVLERTGTLNSLLEME